MKEMFSWSGSAKFEYSNPGEKVQGGASGFGTFGEFVDTIFRSPTQSMNRSERITRICMSYDFPKMNRLW